MYLRIGYEFDGAWNRGYANKTSYILAFRRIVEVMREQAVKNVAYVWQASTSPLDDIIDTSHENIQDWYPGDAYVDWLGLSWFLPADEVGHGQTSQRLLADEVVTLARFKHKPVMIAEAAPQGYDLTRLTKANISPLWDGAAAQSRVSKTAEQIWQQWFRPFFEYIHANSDVIRAVAYINAEWDAQPLWSAPYRQGYWGDSRVQINPEIRQLWLDEISQSSFWQYGEPGLDEK